MPGFGRSATFLLLALLAEGYGLTGSSYAAAGSLVIVLIWVYYAAQVFLLGAEFTRVYAEAHGSHRERSPVSPTVSDT